MAHLLPGGIEENHGNLGRAGLHIDTRSQDLLNVKHSVNYYTINFDRIDLKLNLSSSRGLLDCDAA
jgi:hypothetical protein